MDKLNNKTSIPDGFYEVNPENISTTRNLLWADTGGKNIFVTLRDNPKEWATQWTTEKTVTTYTFYIYKGDDAENMLEKITEENEGTWFEDTFSFLRR